MSNKTSAESKAGHVAKMPGQAPGSAVRVVPGGAQSETLSAEELRRRRQAYFDRSVCLWVCVPVGLGLCVCGRLQK